MKPTLFLLACWFYVAVAFAQTPVLDRYLFKPAFDTRFHNAKVLSNGDLLVAGSARKVSHSSEDSLFLVAFSQAGVLLWEKIVPVKFVITDRIDILPLTNGHFVLFVNQTECDSDAHQHLTYMSNEGDLIWNTIAGFGQYQFSTLFPYDDSSFLLGRNTNGLPSAYEYQLWDVDGTLLNTLKLPFSYAYNYFLTPEFTYVPSGSMLTKFGEQLTVQHTVDLKAKILDIDTLSEGRMLLLTADSLIIVDTALIPVESFPGLTGAVQLTTHKDTVYLLRQDNEHDDVFLYRLNEQYEPEYAYPLPKEWKRSNLAKTQDALFLWGTTGSRDSTNLSAIVARLNTSDPTFSGGSDIALVGNKHSDSVTYEKFPFPPPWLDSITVGHYTFGPIELLVANEGSDTVYQFEVKCRIFSPCSNDGFPPFLFVYCGRYLDFTKMYSGIPLLPNTEQWITFDSNFIVDCVLSPGTISSPYPELCFWVNAPNGRQDINSDNDVTCVDFLTTGNTERPSVEKDVFVFPNPAFGTIRLSQHVIGSRFQLIDASGSVLEKGVLMENQIDCHSRPAGIYMLLIERPDGIFRALRFVLMQ